MPIIEHQARKAIVRLREEMRYKYRDIVNMMGNRGATVSEPILCRLYKHGIPLGAENELALVRLHNALSKRGEKIQLPRIVK